MSAKPKDAICCPVCRSELSLEQITRSLDDEQAFTRLVALSVPMAHLVVMYVGLFTPEKQALTLRKKVRLIAQLLPDLQRQTITHKGRDWTAPHQLWERAIEQVLAARAAGRIDLPFTSHGYLYAVLAGMAEKKEASAEALREAERRSDAQEPRNTVTVGGVPAGIKVVMESAFGGSYTAIPEAPKKTAPPNEEMRAKIAAMLGKPGAQP